MSKQFEDQLNNIKLMKDLEEKRYYTAEEHDAEIKRITDKYAAIYTSIITFLFIAFTAIFLYLNL